MGQGCLFLLLLLVVASIAVPLTNRQKRFRRDDESSSNNMTIPLNSCMLDNKFYERGQEVPSLGPCEKCICEAPDVVCSMIKCQPNSGCRIIQQSGQCCPEYKCDCEYNGQVYNNGERLDKPEDPCQVCYCKGGEIMCTSITCYERDDCKPIYTAGQCCPKYDHCPVETRASGNSVRSVNTSLYSPKREMQPWPLTKPTNQLTSVSSDESSSPPNVYPQTIRIVEILPTTPGPINKPSEVSVIPRIKTNDRSESKENEESSKVASSTPESSTEYSSSTSEIEHLLDTTPEIKESKSEPTTENIHASSSTSTLNPLAESIDPNTLPDSYRFSTVYPNYYHTERDLNSIEEDTTNINVPEGSGYELLTGGLYEDMPTSETFLNDQEVTTTEPEESVTNITVQSEEMKGEHPVEVSDINKHTPTVPVNVSDPEFDQNNTGIEHKCLECITGLQATSALSTDASSESESVESIENVSESSNEDSHDNMNITSIEGNVNSMNSSLNLNPLLKHNISSEEFVLNKTEIDVDSSTTVEPITSTMITTHFDSNENESRTDKVAEISGMTSEHNHKSSTEVDYSVASTEPSEIYLVTQIPDELSTNGIQFERMRVSGNYRNLDDGTSTKLDIFTEQSPDPSYSSNAEKSPVNPSSISFPPVLNVHTLDYSEMSTKKESQMDLNTSSMAKVGIYHPTKPNESASYLTVVDDKNNVTLAKGENVSSHILLTPNDLKKLAEILIHEKIKPAYTTLEMGVTESMDAFQTPETSSSSSYVSNYRSIPDNEFHTRLLVDNTSVEQNDSERIENNTQLFDLNNLSSQTITSSPEDLNTNTGMYSSTAGLLEIREINTQQSPDLETESFNVTETSQDETAKNDISSTSGSSESRDVNEDPNTSRQIRIPDDRDQFSPVLDDRDLIILENFFKKNMDLH